MRKDASEADSRCSESRCSLSLRALPPKNQMRPMLGYSWAKTSASMRVSFWVRKDVQNFRMEVADVKSQCSANIFSFFVVERRSGKMRDGIGCDSEYCESATMWAPRCARAVSATSPKGVNGPCKAKSA